MRADEFLDGPSGKSAADFLDGPGAKAAPDASWSDNLRDIAAAALKIGPTALKGVADLGRLATGDRIGVDTSNAMKRGMEAIDQVIGSDALNAQKANINQALEDPSVGITDLPGIILRNPRAAADTAISTVGSMFLPAGAAAGTVKMLPTIAKLFPRMASVTPGAAATVASVLTGAAQNAAETFVDTEGQALGDRYQGAGISGAASLVLGKLLGGGAEGVIARRLAGESVGRGVIEAGKSAIKTGAKEFLQEGGEESANYVGKQTAKGDAIDLNAMGKQGLYGGMIGLGVGAGSDVATNAADIGKGGIERQVARAIDQAAQDIADRQTPQAEVVNRILKAIEQTQNVQNVPPATGAEAKAPANEAPAPARSDAAQAARVPAEPAAPELEAAGLTFDDLVPPKGEAQALQLTQQSEQAPQPVTQSAQPGTTGEVAAASRPKPAAPILQNRNRATPSSIAQMQSIAAQPDYGRLGFSRDFANGAPVVAGGQVPAEQLGRQDVAVASDGRRIPVQYAVVEAFDVLPSNSADGTPNADYATAVDRIRAIAGNGRIAGLQLAYRKGTTADYLRELQGDTLHGVNPEVIRRMRAPVLVRVMPADQVTNDIGDVSNTVGNLSLSAVEQANNDAQRVDLDALSFAEDGGITPEAVRQFVRAMPQAEQGGLIDTNGQPTKQAVDRLNAAVFAKAYGNDQLIRLFAQAQDPEARNVLSALAQVAPKMARLEGAGALDIRDVVTQAAEIAVNARREGKALSLAARQMDMTADPMVGVVLDLFAANPRSVKPVVEALSNAADFAYTEATKPAEDMFGEVPRASRQDVINQLRPQNERASQENLEQPAGREPVQGDAGRAEADTPAATDPTATEAGRPAEAEGLTTEADGIVIQPGKGLIKGKFLAEVDGDGVPGGPWDTEQAARDAAIQWRQTRAQRAQQALVERQRRDSIADQFRSGERVSGEVIQSLGFRLPSSEVRFFIPLAADLFGLQSRQVRPLIRDLIRKGQGIYGGEVELVPTRQALEAIAKSQRAQGGAEQAPTARKREAEYDDQRDLIITHNLTAENLLHAVKMGGIPVPSLAEELQQAGADTVFESNGAYNAEAARRPYTDDRQLQLFLDNGPDPSQAGSRGEAAQRQAVSAVDDIRSTETLLGLALSRDYAARQRASLVGQKVSSAEDLAVLAQVYRDPRFETFRVVFVNDAGRVVSQVGLTSRLPASAVAIMGNDVDAYLRDLSATARSRGATGFYLLHNHPSGIATPSRADIVLTTTFAQRMPMLEFKSHVVIDTNEYATIDRHGTAQQHKRDFGQPAPYRAPEWANVSISGPADVMVMAKRLQVDNGAITLIHTDNQYRVKAISTIPASVGALGKQELRKQILKASLQTHGAQVFAVGRDVQVLRQIGEMVVDAIHVEDVSGKVSSLRSIGMIPGGTPFPESRRTRVSPDSSPEFNYLRRTPQTAALQRVAEDGPQYSAAPATDLNPFGRDALGHIKFRLGEVALHKLDAATRPLQERFGMRMASPELRKQLRQMKATIEEAKRKAVDVVKEMSAMSEADRIMVSDIVEKMLAPGVIPPEHAVRVADAITKTMDQQTDELVALGMLSAESAERWRGRYLPRIYNRQTELGDDPLIKRLFKTGAPTAAGIGGGSLKGRGLFQDVSIDSVDQWLALGYEVRDPHWKLVQGKLELKDPNAPKVAREKVTVWRDWTPSERAQMGEIRDAMYRFVMGYTAMQRDIALGRLFNNIANNPEWVRRSGSEGWVQVPDTEIPGTGGVKRYGNLAGLWVRKDVMSHLTQFEEAANDTLQLYREALGLWKEGKTALNPVAHLNNILSNLSMAHFAGVSYWDVHKYAAAAKDLIDGAPMVDEARKAGLFTGSFTKEEMVQHLPPELQKLANMEEGRARRAGRLLMDAMTFWLRQPLRAAYEFEDSFFKYLIYRDARQQGLSPEDATDYALRYIFTYDDLPSGARKVRDYAIPFFSWTYKAVPALLHTAMVYPWRFLAPAAVLHGINAVAYALAAGDEGDDWLEKLAKGRELEKEEREALPDRTAGYGLLLNPKTIRLGTDSLTGNPVFLDVSRVVPGGDMFDMVNQAGGLPLPAPVMPNHPVLSAFSAMIANREMFFGGDIVDKNDTSIEAAEKRAKWMAGLLLPAVAPGGYHSQRILDAAAAAADTVITTPLGDFTGVGRDGLPVQPKYAAMQTVGIKARPFDLELEAQRKKAQEAALINSIAAEVRSMARLHQRGAVSDRMMDEAREKAREKIDRIRQGERP